MDSFELNKIIGAILGTLLFVMGVGFLAEAIYHPIQGAGPGYALPGDIEGGDEPDQPDKPAVSIGTLLASADPVAGQASAKKCQSCHDFSEANANKTGPGLYDIVERKIASHPGFGYSQALIDKSSETWTYQKLSDWLLGPKAFAPGTKMVFGGIKSDEERANILAYLATLSPSPKPFPPAETPVTEAPVTEPAASSEPVSSEPVSPEPASSEPPAASTESSSAPQ